MGDLNDDCKVNLCDLEILANQWLLEILFYDFNGDRFINFLDFAVFANSWQGSINQLAEFVSQWLKAGAYNADIAPSPSGDGIVNFRDFAVMAKNWLIDCNTNPLDPACVPK